MKFILLRTCLTLTLVKNIRLNSCCFNRVIAAVVQMSPHTEYYELLHTTDGPDSRCLCRNSSKRHLYREDGV